MNLERRTQNAERKTWAIAFFAGAIAWSVLGAQSGAGSISGIVATKARGLKPLRVTIDQRVCGNELPDEAVVVDGAGHLANAVVTLVGAKIGRHAQNSTVMNEKCRFAPRVQVVRPNATITTSSRDPILHTTNASMDGGKGLFNVAVPVPGINIAKKLAGAGLVRLVCNTHPWMRGYVIVTDDIAAVTSADGRFTLNDVPAGTYELRIWHETLKGTPQKVTVEASKTATIDFELK